METQGQTQVETPKMISVADFTAFSTRSKKIYEDSTEEQIKDDLAELSETNVLHSITNYAVLGRQTIEFTKPFEPKANKVS